MSTITKSTKKRATPRARRLLHTEFVYKVNLIDIRRTGYYKPSTGQVVNLPCHLSLPDGDQIIKIAQKLMPYNIVL